MLVQTVDTFVVLFRLVTAIGIMIFRAFTTIFTQFARLCYIAEFLAVEASGHVNICFLDVFGRSEEQLVEKKAVC